MGPRSLLLLLVTAAFAAPAGSAERACEQSESTVTASPQGRLAASVQHQVCETAIGGVSAAITVFVGEAGAPMQGGRVLAVAVPRTREEWPVAVWRDENLLEVWVPNLAKVLQSQSSWREVTVALKYCGDDPALRERVARHEEDLRRWREEVTRWAEARRRDPEGAGPRPQRPEDPPSSSRPCTDADFAGRP
jgi:hypothetical protein